MMTNNTIFCTKFATEKIKFQFSRSSSSWLIYVGYSLAYYIMVAPVTDEEERVTAGNG